MALVTIIDYSTAIKFLTIWGLIPISITFTPIVIEERLDSVYGRGSLSNSEVNEWTKRFRMKQKSFRNNTSCERPLEDKVVLWESRY